MDHVFYGARHSTRQDPFQVTMKACGADGRNNSRQLRTGARRREQHSTGLYSSELAIIFSFFTIMSPPPKRPQGPSDPTRLILPHPSMWLLPEQKFPFTSGIHTHVLRGDEMSWNHVPSTRILEAEKQKLHSSAFLRSIHQDPPLLSLRYLL